MIKSVVHKNVSAVILAGGRATRMGGQDKGLIEIAGQPLVARISEQLEYQVGQILINANRNLERYKKCGFKVIIDSLDNFQGPLAGMLTALQCIDNDWLIVVPCDGPYIASDYCDRMISAASEQSVQLAVATDGERLQPVYALLHRELISSLTTFIKNGGRKIDRWYAQHPFARVDFSDSVQMFTNVNTPEQLTRIEQQIP